MVVLFAGGVWICDRAEQGGIPQVAALHVASRPTASQAGGNMEGKETRFGIGASVLTTVTTSDTSTGNTNSMPDSYTPIGGAVALVNMLLGEIVFGGLGTGLYSLILVALLGVFITGLMIGRTPEYIGKQIGPTEMKFIALYTLVGPAAVLLCAAVAANRPAGLAGLTTNSGPHGLSEILVAYATCMANNGLSFGGLSVNSPFYNISTMIPMVAGRFFLAIPALALAGRFAAQGRRATDVGTLQTDTPMFGAVIVGTALIVGALSFFPALALGPMVEHLVMSH
jgi:K+-transporting ATPase ATPase A chain